MKSQDHKAANENKAKVRPGIKSSPQVKHPILQLQQLVGNKTTTRLIQRHDDQFMDKYQFKVIDNDTGEPQKLYAPTGKESGESSRSASDIIGSAATEEDDIYED